MIEVNAGDRIPADCLMIDEMNVLVDQSNYYPGTKENFNAEKNLSEHYDADSEHPDNHHLNPDPFLLTDSKIMTGQGKAIVCAVGSNTLLARIRGNEQYVVKES